MLSVSKCFGIIIIICQDFAGMARRDVGEWRQREWREERERVMRMYTSHSSFVQTYLFWGTPIIPMIGETQPHLHGITTSPTFINVLAFEGNDLNRSHRLLNNGIYIPFVRPWTFCFLCYFFHSVCSASSSSFWWWINWMENLLRCNRR